MLSSMVWARLSPEATATAPKVMPNAPAYRPMPTAARSISVRAGTRSPLYGSGTGPIFPGSAVDVIRKTGDGFVAEPLARPAGPRLHAHDAVAFAIPPRS